MLFVSLAVIGGSVKWDQTSLQVMQGDDVTITCSTEDVGFFDVVRISKQSYLGVTTIADNDNMKRPFADSKRYNVSYKHDMDSDTGTMSLTYRGMFIIYR